MTDLDTRIINLFDKGYLPSDIGRRVGLPALSVRERLALHGIAAPTSARVTESHLWEHLDDDARRDRIIAQDMKFRAAMKREYFPDPPALPVPPLRRPHRFLDVGYRPESADLIRSPMHWKRVLSEVAEQHGLTVNEVLSKRRDKRVIAARRECCWRMKQETSMSLPQIGTRMGLDHTTVLHHVRLMEREIASTLTAGAA